MLIERFSIFAGLAAAAFLFASPASALSMAECSAKYNAAKEAGTLDGKTWNQFRKAECGASVETKASKKTASDSAKSDEEGVGLTMAECSDKYQAAKSAGTLNGMKWNDFRKAECGAGASASVEAAKAAAPDSAKSDSSGGGLSMAECSTKYQAAKSAGTLNGMKWNDFRKAECGPGANSAAASAEPAPTKTSDNAAKSLTMAECSDKYQAAKSAGTLNDMKWNEFRKAECGAGATDDETVPSVDEAKYNGDPETPKTKAPRGVKFPTAISKKFSDENPGKARMHTCLQEYYANKDADTLGGLRWIQKGGGYYSLCNARLKG
jgi:hypothetical protein